MSQAFYTAIGGISAAQSKLDVVADNISNMNTVGFKESQITFGNILSRTISTGSPATNQSGGTNPLQIGLGVTIGGITRNFEGSTIQSTGRSSDLYLRGNGFFTLQDEDGGILLTRAGNFTLDSEGNLTNQNGLKVIGTDTVSSSTSNTATVKVPPALNLSVTGNPNAATKNLKDLNNAEISAGTFSFTVNDGTGAARTINITLTDTDVTLNDICAKINAAFDNEFADGAVVASINNGKLSIVIDSTVMDGTDETSRVASLTGMVSGTSNFFDETGLAVSTGVTNGSITTFTSETLDYVASISPPDGSYSTSTKADYSIKADGSVSITYGNGDTISVETDGNKKVLVYTTADGVIIRNADITVNGGVITPANLQLQLANVVNENGLISEGGNTFKVGPNAGKINFSVAGENGFGNISSGGLEASNVNLSTQFTEMILAQRSIDANSRTFQAMNEVLRRIVQLGQ